MKYIDIQLEIATINVLRRRIAGGYPLAEESIISELTATGIRDTWEGYMLKTYGHKGDFDTRIKYILKGLSFSINHPPYLRKVQSKQDGYPDNVYVVIDMIVKDDMNALEVYYNELIEELFEGAAPEDTGSGAYVYASCTDDGTDLDEDFEPILTPEHMRIVKEIADKNGIDYPFVH